MVWNVFYFRWGTLQTFQNALRMFLNAFQRFQMRCAEKRLNAIFIKPGFPKEGHISASINQTKSIMHDIHFDLNNELLTTGQALIARVRRVEYTRDK